MFEKPTKLLYPSIWWRSTAKSRLVSTVYVKRLVAQMEVNVPASTIKWVDAGFMLGQRHRRLINMKPALVQSLHQGNYNTNTWLHGLFCKTDSKMNKISFQFLDEDKIMVFPCSKLVHQLHVKVMHQFICYRLINFCALCVSLDMKGCICHFVNKLADTPFHIKRDEMAELFDLHLDNHEGGSTPVTSGVL